MTLAAHIADQAVPAVLAVVAVHEDETSHYERDPDTGDIHVSVITHDQGSPIKALLHGTGGRGVGVWCIPPVGTEVAVVFPNGDFEGDPVLFGGGGAPEGLDAATILIVAPRNGKVLIHDGAGSTEPLVRRSDFEGHTHGPGTFNAPSGGGPITGASGGAASITGTSVLEAK